jgi:putative tributyrin esterase
MRRLLLALLLCACSRTSSPAPTPTSAPAAAPAQKGTVSTHSFHSDALGVDKSYLVYLPVGYDASTARYPVVYMLHGLGGDENNWVKYGHADAAADALGLEAIIVFPDGDSSFYANSVTSFDYDTCVATGKGVYGRVRDNATFCVRTPRYEDYIVKDLVKHVDATYRTIPERRARGLSGNSMGGFGALQLALRHPDVFGSAVSHSGMDALLYEGPYPYDASKAKVTDDVKNWGVGAEPIGAWVRGIFGTDLQNWKAHDPAVLAIQVKDVALYLDGGTDDRFGLNAGAEYLHDLLTKAGIPHAYTMVQGGRHDFSLWSERVDDGLAFHAAYFAKKN